MPASGQPRWPRGRRCSPPARSATTSSDLIAMPWRRAWRRRIGRPSSAMPAPWSAPWRLSPCRSPISWSRAAAPSPPPGGARRTGPSSSASSAKPAASAGRRSPRPWRGPWRGLPRRHPPEGLGIVDDEAVGVQGELGLEAAEEALIGHGRTGGCAPVAGVALRDRPDRQLRHLHIGDGERRRLARRQVEAAQRQGVGERRGGDIDVHAAGELGDLLAAFAPVAAAVGAEMALAAAVHIVKLEVELARVPAGIAFELVAQPEGRRADKRHDLAPGDDMVLMRREAKMLQPLAPPRLPEHGAFGAHGSSRVEPVVLRASRSRWA